MTLLSELSALSVWVYCWLTTITILWLLSFIWMWQFSLCCLLFMIPFLLFIRWWYKNRVHCSLNHVLKPFLHGYINITLLAMFGQAIGLAIITSIFASTKIMFHVAGYLFYIFISIALYVSIEEVLKLYFNIKARDAVGDPIRQINKSHTITSTATALGYSMCTGMLWTAFAAYELNKLDEKDDDRYSLFGWLFLITLIIAVLGMPMHLITGYLTGCKITQRDIEYARRNEMENVEDDGNNRLPFKSYIKVVYYSIFVRSSYLFFLMVGFLVFQFTIVGVIIAFLGIILDYVLLIKHTKLIESMLPFDYLQRAGQLSIFGYNILSDAPDDDAHRHEVQVTSLALNRFSVDLDEPMVVRSIDDEDDRSKSNNDDINEQLSGEKDIEVEDIQVSSAVLSDSENDDIFNVSDSQSVR